MPLGVFVRAAIGEAKVLTKKLGQGEIPGAVEFPGMALIDLATLSDTVTGRDDGVELLDDSVRVPGGAAVPLPSDLVSALGTLRGQRLTRTAQAWAASEECRGLVEASEAERVLRELQKLCSAGMPVLFLGVG